MNKIWLSTPRRSWLTVAGLCGLLAVSACSKPGIKRIAEGQQFSGFLKNYTDLHAHPLLGSDALTFVNKDANKNLRHYVAIIVDPVEIYVSTKADASLVPERARETVAVYFRHALETAVGSAYPI